jgi:peptide/nickel transport system substrate-binding protein
VAAVALAAGLVAAACGGSSGSQAGGAGGEGAVKEGGILRLGTMTGIDSLNPFVTFQQDSYSTFEYIYPFLVQYNTKTLQYAPDFATKWETSADGLTWTFHTVPNAKWSDGQPLTAADVAWTFNTIIKFGNGPTANFSQDFTHIDSIATPDANTVVLTYKTPVAVVLSNLQQVPILPQHVWEKYATGNGKELKLTPNTPQNGQPLVSGGPFVLTKYQTHAITLFERNPNFYGTKPHIEGFGLEFFTNDDAAVTALKSGQLDAVESIPVTSVATLKAAGLNVFIGPGLEFHDFIINSNPKKTTNPELQNPQVRQAFEYAIDRASIVKTAWLGYAQPGTTIVPPGTGAWHDSSIEGLPFDLAKANQLLDQAGFPKGSDGIRVANGHPMSYTVIFPHDETGAGDRAFQIIQNDFQQIGVKITQRNMDDSAAFAAITAPGETGYTSFDLAMWDWVPLEDPDFILSVMQCNQYGAWSDSGYCDPTYDQMYEQQASTVNVAARRRIVYQMQEQLFNDRPYIVINYQDITDAWDQHHWAGFVESNQGLFNPLSKESLTQLHQV